MFFKLSKDQREYKVFSSFLLRGKKESNEILKL